MLTVSDVCYMYCRPMLGRLYVCLMVTLAVLTFIANALLDVVKSESLRVCIVSLLKEVVSDDKMLS